MVDERLYEELAARSVAEVVCEPLCRYDEDKGCYVATLWGGTYAVDAAASTMTLLDGAPAAHAYFGVFLLNYLLLPKRTEPSRRWISVKDLAGGATFFRGPHAVPTDAITAAFGDDLAALRRRCRQLGGEELDMADCSFSFTIAGSVRVALLYWRGDDEFPAEAKLLLDDSIADMPLDVIFALVYEICARVGG